MPTRSPSKIVFVFCLIVLFAHSAFGQATKKQIIAGKLLEVKIAAPSLKGNLLGDPVEQTIAVYLPPGYDAAPSKKYPTVYLLHGFGGGEKTWASGRWNIQPLLDALIGEGKIREMIVVAPNGRNAYGGSYYVNSAVTGNWEDYTFRDVVGFVDANYRTLARPSSRGIAGHSMGGYGAIAVGMKHPDVFSVVYALSPCCLDFDPDLSEADPVWKRVQSLTSRDQLPKELKTLDDFSTSVVVAQAAAFSPNVARLPFYADFLYREQGGKFLKNEAVYAKWQSKMPLYMVAENKQNLLNLRGIFIDYGQKEEFSDIRIATAHFSDALAERSIPHVFEIYSGGTHTNKIKERLETRVFAFFSDKLDFQS